MDSNLTQKETGLRLELRGLGHVPSAKNSMFAVVNPKYRDWKRLAVASFVSQCISNLATTVNAISIMDLREFVTRSLPADDSWKNIPVILLTCERVSKGQEGATITITKL